MQFEPGRLPPPPKLIPILANGFNTVANHIALILMPVLLDVYLWLGPRVGLKHFFQPWIAQIPVVSVPGGPSLTQLLNMREGLTTFSEHFNLISLLRTFPVGVTSLMFGWRPLESPLGKTAVTESSSILAILGMLLLLVLAGWSLGALYFHWTARAALSLEKSSTLRAVTQTVLLSVLWSVILVSGGVPVIWVILLISMISPVLGNGILFLFGLFAMWFVLPIFFSPHGIYINRQSAFASAMSSLRMMRYTLPSSGLFMVGAFIISQGFGYLWHVPAESSWWVLVGIFGHAFVTTGLLAASFVYYRDVNAWLKTVFEQLQMQSTSTRA